MSTISGFYEKSELTGYAETMRSLQVEVDMFRDAYTSVYNSFDDYRTITSGDHRNKRSVLPIIGQLMSPFGTVSESDLESVNRNVNILARNQKRVIHDLKACMSVLNLTRVQVIENRRSIMDLIIVVQRLDREISALEEQFEKKIGRLEQFLHTYLQFKLILDEIRLMTQDAMFYLENLKLELNMLSLQHLSTNTISPSNLREILTDVESRLPSNFELTSNPRIDIWYFYKTLTSVTYLQDDEIRIILKIPLLNTNQKYDIYKVYNLLILKPLTGSHVLIKYSLETDAFMMSWDRTKFTFLSKSKYQKCKNHHLQLCNPETAFYQANVNKFCVIALFMRNKPDIKLFCKQMVVLNQKLPFAKHLSSGFWTVITNIPLTFTINCLSGASSDILVKPYFGILKLNNTCKASSDYLQLPIYLDKQTKYDRIDPLDTLLEVHNISEISFLNVSHDESVKFKSMTLPPHLANLREIPMQNFLHEVSMYEDTDFGTCKLIM